MPRYLHKTPPTPRKYVSIVFFFPTAIENHVNNYYLVAREQRLTYATVH